MHVTSLTGKWRMRQVDGEAWLPATVPGGVHTDLLAAGRIPDPFVADYEKQVMWVAEADWEYRRTFRPSPAVLAEERVYLVCDGLDTLAEVTLNGQPLDSTADMFRQYRWEVKDLLVEGANELSIVFRSPVAYIRAMQERRLLSGLPPKIAMQGAPHLRKSPSQFGWDWGPMLPAIGIWRDIRLEGRSEALIEDVHLRQFHDEQGVRITAQVVAEQWGDAPLTARLRVTDPSRHRIEVTAPVVHGSAELEAPIAQPKLWWPNGMPSPYLRPNGEQPLYRVEVALLAGDAVCDRQERQMGLRTIELHQEPDEWGKSFTFVVNGVPMFCKGANWIPADSFPTRISDGYLEHLIRGAAQANMNMLRVWGGGFYEEERFYDLCDRYGIMVWQDGIFACAIYPLDEPAFLDELRVEVGQNVRRLRHRASLALWCGNNEMEQGWESWGWAVPEWRDEALRMMAEYPILTGLSGSLRDAAPLPDWRQLRDAYERFFFTTLPKWIIGLDPDRAYWPSSPSSNTPFHDVNGESQGDAHYWGVWHGREPFTAYREHYPRFMSEFGFQALPPFPTIATYAQPGDQNMTSYIMEHHQRGNHSNGLIVAQMTESFRMPKDFRSLVYLSLVLQAEGVRYGVEHYRRYMDRVKGTLYWQLNDCWPVASWASMDYFGRWKALHYAAKRFYAPVLLSILDEPPRMSLYISNDLPTPWNGAVAWSLETLGGEVVRGGARAVRAAALAATRVAELDLTLDLEGLDRRDLVLVAELVREDQVLARQVATFLPNKHLSLSDPGLSVEVSEAGGVLSLRVAAKRLARFVELSLAGADVVFSDNYYDVPARRAVTVTCPLPDGWTLARAQEALRVRSLWDSF